MHLRDCDFQVYWVSYTFDRIVRTPTFGGMDSEYSHTESNQPGKALVVAPSSALARSLFEYQNRTQTVTSVELVGDVFRMIRG